MTKNAPERPLSPTSPSGPGITPPAPPTWGPISSPDGPPNAPRFLELDAGALSAAAKNINPVVEEVHSGGRAFGSDTERAADALGSGWATAAAMRQVSSQWTTELKRVADELSYMGDAVEACSRTHQWSEQQIQNRVNQIRVER